MRYSHRVITVAMACVVAVISVPTPAWAVDASVEQLVGEASLSVPSEADCVASAQDGGLLADDGDALGTSISDSSPHALQAQASFTSGGITYSLDADDNATIVSINRTGGELLIPSTIDGHAVVALGDGTKSVASSYSLKSVVIPDSVVTIADEAFYGCTGLESVSLGSSVRQIGDKAFTSCKVTSLEIPASVERVGAVAFSRCKSLTRIGFGSPSSLVEIGEEAFRSCDALGEVVLPNSLTTLGKGAFASCGHLTTAVLSERLREVPEEAFSSCSSLSTLVFGGSETEVGKRAFYLCTGLNDLVLPRSVRSIGEEALYCRLNSLVVSEDAIDINAECLNKWIRKESTVVHAWPGSAADAWAQDYANVAPAVGHLVTWRPSPGLGGTLKLSSPYGSAGSRITITPVPAEGYEVVGVSASSGVVIGPAADGTYTLTMPSSDVALVAEFEKGVYRVTATVEPIGAGEIGLSATSASVGDQVVVTVSPKQGYGLVGVTSSAGSVVQKDRSDAYTYVLTMPGEDVAITATLDAQIHRVQAASAEGGTVHLAKTTSATGGEVTFSVETEESWRLVGVRLVPAEGGEGISLEADDTGVYRFVMPGEDVLVVPEFTSRVHTIKESMSAGEGLSGRVELSEASACEGDIVTVRPIAEPSYRVAAVSASAGTLEGPDEQGCYTLRMPDEDVLISADFLYDPIGVGERYGEDADQWVCEDGVWYVYRSGMARRTCWVELKGKWYYLDDKGLMSVGWRCLGGLWYYFNPVHDGTYGCMKTGWACDSGTWYYLEPTVGSGTQGAMRTGWLSERGAWYWLGSSGAMATGLVSFGSDQYYFPETYYFGSDGVMRTGWQTVDGARRFFRENGKMAYARQTIDGRRYSFGMDGVLAGELTGYDAIVGSWAQIYYSRRGWSNLEDSSFDPITQFRANGTFVQVSSNGDTYSGTWEHVQFDDGTWGYVTYWNDGGVMAAVINSEGQLLMESVYNRFVTAYFAI